MYKISMKSLHIYVKKLLFIAKYPGLYYNNLSVKFKFLGYYSNYSNNCFLYIKPEKKIFLYIFIKKILVLQKNSISSVKAHAFSPENYLSPVALIMYNVFFIIHNNLYNV
jgi:hypothetical protein